MFRVISLALEILLDPAKRNFIDTKLTQARAQAARRADMDAKRKAGVDDLLRREEDAKRARMYAVEHRKAAAEEERVREAGRKMVQEAMAKARADAAAASSAAGPKTKTPAAPSTARPPLPPFDPLDLVLIITLAPGTALGDSDALRSALEARYGAIATVKVNPPPAAKAGKKAKGPRAVVEFATGNWGGCWACLHDHSGGDGAVPLEKGAKAKWAADKPAWLTWAETYGSTAERRAASSSKPLSTNGSSAALSASSTPPAFGSAAAFSSAPDFGSTDPAAAMRAHTSARAAEASRESEDTALRSAYESATLLRMRQRERERLAEQIRLEEDGEE